MSTTTKAARRFAPFPVALRARDVTELAVASGYPCISVLLPTQPADRMASPDQGGCRHCSPKSKNSSVSTG